MSYTLMMHNDTFKVSRMLNPDIVYTHYPDGSAH